MTDLWPWLLGAAAACYGLKLAGMSVPDKVLRHPRVSLVADLLPIALLSALIAVQTLCEATGRSRSTPGWSGSVQQSLRWSCGRRPLVVIVAAAAAAVVRLI